MSFANLVLTENFISVISDGQITENGRITQTHFKKFIVHAENFVIVVTGYQIIVQEIKKKFHYQPKLSYEEARDFLRILLEKYQEKRVNFGQNLIAYSAVIAGFTPELRATVFHIEKSKMTSKDYQKPALLSLLPDDIDFNPNELMSQQMSTLKGSFSLPLAQSLQRNALYHVAKQSQTVNQVIFQESIRKSDF